MSNKSETLIFIPHFEPGFKYGGPIRSIKAMTAILGEKVHFTIFTSDRDYGDLYSFSNIELNKVLIKEDYDVIYSNRGIIEMIKFINQYHKYSIIYLNSYFSFRYSILIIFLKRLGIIKNKITLCPRGEFNEGALNIKGAKKKIFIQVAKKLGIYNSITWHATTEEEELSIQKIFGVNCIVKYAPVLPSSFAFKKKEKNNLVKEPLILKLAFLSRVSRIKNLDFLLNELLIIDGFKENGEFSIKLDIYGPISDAEYWSFCKSLIDKFSSNRVNIEYKGEVLYENVFNILEKYHFWVLPSLGENYGQAIADSLVANCPIILSDKTPWTKDIEKYNLGFVRKLEKNCFVEIIVKCLYMDNVEYSRLRGNIMLYVSECLIDKNNVKKNLNIFLDEN
ncbi:glycosyltransferase [Myroides odoratimimus]|uniref:glycosyltransferase n=1 Tax=Myroides odoratimimus TaxID=76832 RepID=UPI00072B83E6|nr:glycosyltransferase [Myroides odoratimimus]GAQ14816.1 glycosyltransferase [Myroides odoratimimus]STZ48873.1 Uncharacterised protein [Myroides odoratimimus]